MRRPALLLALNVLLGWCLSAAGQQWGVRGNGQVLKELAPPGTRAVVLFFVASDCPVSNRTFPEMRRLRMRFQGQGVRTWFVYPNEGEKPEGIEAHQRAFDDGGAVLQDSAGVLVRLTHAVATPEVAVLVPGGSAGWRSVYVGRVDDRYVRLGLERPAATEFFGEEAVAAVLAGRVPKPASGAPVGCAIMNPGVR